MINKKLKLIEYQNQSYIVAQTQFKYSLLNLNKFYEEDNFHRSQFEEIQKETGRFF